MNTNKKYELTQIKKILFFLFTLSTFYFLLSTALAAPHISGKHIPGQPKDYVHKIPDVHQLRARGLSPRAIQEAIGAVGPKKVAVILVDFSSVDGTCNSPFPTISKFSDIRSYISELKNFYKEVSYNNLGLEFDYYPSSTTAYSLTQTMSYYGYATADTENGDILIKNAISMNSDIKHKNAGGIYDAVIVVHAGYGNEAVGSSNTGDVWSALYSFSNTQGFTEGLTVPETALSGQSPFGVYCHEFGHQLGLPDLYNTNSGLSQVGKWCLMDYGTWANNGFNPSHPSIWCKQLLEWVSPVNISSTVTNTSLSAVEVSSQGIKIPISVASDLDNEYFLLEYRYTNAASYDNSLPGSGILIWHIDDTIGGGSGHWDFSNYNNINNNSAHRRIDLEEADSSDPSINNGNSTDPWPGTKNTFNSPQSDAYNGNPSGITVLNFAGVGSSSMNFSISFQPWIRGLVKNSAGKGINGVMITATAISVSTTIVTTTDSTGHYLLSLDSGTYTVIPSTTNYSYYPSSRTVTVVDYSDNQDFTATLRTEITTLVSVVIPENNVFNPAKGGKTTIWYNVAGSWVKLQIYTFDGLLVKTLVDEDKPAGYYSEFWDGKNSDEEIVASGIYLLYFEVNGTKQVKKIAIVK